MNRFYLLAVGLLLAFSLSAQLSPGDIAITYYQSDNDDVAGFVATTTIPGGTEILITDNGWLSSGAFRGGEGIVQFTVPAAGLNCGDEFFFIDGVFSDGDGAPFGTTNNISGSLILSTGGDQLFVYQDDNGTISFIAGIQMNGGWEADATSSNTSAQPASLTGNNTSVAPVPENDNGMYNGSVIMGDRATLLAAINNPDNWTLSNDEFMVAGSLEFGFTCDAVANMAPVITNCDAVSNGGDGFTVGASATSPCSSGLPDYTVFITATDTEDDAAGTELTITQIPPSAPAFVLANDSVEVKLFVTDSDGAVSDTCRFFFRVVPTAACDDAPVIEDCLMDTEIFAGAPDCNGIIPDYTGFVIFNDDADTEVTVEQLPAPGGTFAMDETVEIKLFATDSDGNTSDTCRFNLNVLDGDPAARCVDDGYVVFLDADGSATITVDSIDDGSFDNCGEVTVSIDNTMFDCDDIDATTMMAMNPITELFISEYIEGGGNNKCHRNLQWNRNRHRLDGW